MSRDEEKRDVRTLPRLLGCLSAALLGAAAAVLTFSLLFHGKTLEDQVAELRAAGIATTVEEAFGPKMPDEENAALVYREAFEKFDPPLDDLDLEPLLRDPGDDDALNSLLPRARKAVAENAASLELLRRAAGMPKCRWDFVTAYAKAADWSDATQGAVLFDVRKAAHLLAAQAVVAVSDGDKQGALAAFETLSVLARTLEVESCNLVLLVKCVAERNLLGLHDLIQVRLNLDADDRGRMAAVLERAARADDLTNAMRGELIVTIAVLREMRRKEPFPVKLSGFMRRWRSRYIEFMGFAVEASEKKPWEALVAMKGEKAASIAGRSQLVAMAVAPIAGVFEAKVKLLAQVEVRRAALDELAGKQASGVDPFTGKPLLSRRTATGVKFWSVGPDGVDDGGKPEPVSSRRGTTETNYDIVYEYPAPRSRAASRPTSRPAERGG